jgi:hypothetical protein
MRARAIALATERAFHFGLAGLPIDSIESRKREQKERVREERDPVSDPSDGTVRPI